MNTEGLATEIGGRLPIALVTLAVLGFLRWLIPFVFVRLDVGAAALGRRLSSVEAELSRYREATMLLITELARADPTNKVLREAATILSEIRPRPSMEVDEIVAGLAAIPGNGKPRKRAVKTAGGK